MTRGGRSAAPARLGLLAALTLCAAMHAAAAVDGTTAAFTAVAANSANAVSAAARFRPYRDEVLIDGPVAWYRLDETAGPTAADSAGGNHGTATSGGVTFGVPGATSDTGNRAARFSGTGHISAGDPPALDFGDRFTVEAWARRDNSAAGPQILVIQDLHFSVEFNGNRLTLARPGSGLLAQSTVPVTDTAAFHHLVVTKDGPAVGLYIDGVNRTGAVANQTLTNSMADLNLGSGAFPFAGDLDEVAIYSQPLSAARIAAHYAAR